MTHVARPCRCPDRVVDRDRCIKCGHPVGAVEVPLAVALEIARGASKPTAPKTVGEIHASANARAGRIVALFEQGLSDVQIAQALGTTRSTVRSQRSKLGLRREQIGRAA